MPTRRKILSAALLAAGFATMGVTVPAAAQTTYSIASLADFTGPYADVMKDMVGPRWGAIDWWNNEVGKGLGVRLVLKDYDTRYDVAQTASLWPGILSELRPIAALGVGGPDVAALQNRLPDDKVPLIMATAAYGYAWMPNPWIFNSRPTYGHEASAFYDWYRQQKGITGPLKIGVISSEAAPAYVDIAKGTQKYAADNPDKLIVVETVFTEVQPSDLTTQINRMARAGVQVINIQTNTAAVVATKRALQAIGRKDIPIVMSSHNGLPASGKAAGGLAQLEGDFEVYGMAIASPDKTSSHDFFDMLRDKHKVQANWSSLSVMGLAPTLLLVRAIEAAAKQVGPDKITGEAVRKALLSTQISSEQMFEVLPNLAFSNDAPFPLSGLTVNIGTVKDGKYTIAAERVPVPVVNKW
ncbi:MAG: ABC transporter substrate-binding protein [Pseudomonadota bacterium]|nr:ABC transporter substrate-binding protein [Pseudomonadota bacterium]